MKHIDKSPSPDHINVHDNNINMLIILILETNSHLKYIHFNFDILKNLCTMNT